MTTTKTFNEQISEVVNGKGSIKVKKDALIKLGIRKHEVDLVYNLYSEKSGKVGTYTFGVELECGVQYQLVRARGIQFEAQSYNHTDSRKVFKFVSDGSLNCPNSIECVSPVLDNNKKGFGLLKKCCDALNAQNAVVNKSCGAHVHIGAENLDEKTYANVFVNYMYCEKVIDSFMAKSRRGNGAYYCKSLIGKGLENAYTREQTQMCFTDGHTPNRSMWRSSYRYYKVNAMSWFGHKTIEFRQHGGTTNYEKLSHWIEFLIALVEYSKTNRLTSEVSSIDDIPFIKKAEKDYFKARKAELA